MTIAELMKAFLHNVVDANGSLLESLRVEDDGVKDNQEFPEGD